MFENRSRLSIRAMSRSGVAIVILVTSVLCLYLPQVSATCAARRSDGSCVCRPSSGNLMMSDQEGSMGLVNVEVGRETALVCLSNMTDTMAHVICRQFGYQQKLGFGVVRSSVVDMDVPKYKTYGQCQGYEECLDECEGHSWQLTSTLSRDGSAGPCYQANERALICTNTPDPDAPVRPTPKVFESDLPLTPATGIEPAPAPADQPMVTPTPDSSDHDQPLFPIIDYDMLPPADAPMPTTTLAPVTDPARPQATENTTQSQTINPSTHKQTSTIQPITKLPNHEVDSTSSGTTTTGLPAIQQGSTSTPSSHRLEECERALSRDVLTSPGFPGPYPNDISCGWNITVNLHEKVVFSIYEFRTAEPDGLSIYVGSREGKLIEHLSGTVTAPTRRKKRAIRTIDTGVSSVFVTFTSDGDTTESGFRMGYKAKQKSSPGVNHGAATGPEKKKDGNENRNIIVIVVVIIIVIVLVILLLCCKYKCCKRSGEKVVIYDGFGSKSRIVPYETSEEKPRSGSWVGTPGERDPSFHMDESDEKPPPPVELESSSTSGRRGQHTPEGKAEDESQDIWRSAESGQQGPEVAGPSRPTLPPEDLHAENSTSPAPEVTEDEWEVRDSILFLGEHRPKQPGPKTEGPLDTTIHKKTPPGQEESRIGGGRDLSHLYNMGQRTTSPRDNSSRRPELLVSVPYAASMYTSRGQAIQMRSARGDPGDPVTGSAVSRGAPDVGHTSSILAKQGAKLPPLRSTKTATPTELSTATDEQKMAAAGKVRASGSRPSSSGSAGSRASSANSQRSNTTYTSGRRTSGSGSPPLTSAPPAEFVCPLTGEVMKHPVVFEDGRTYERSAIQAWCETHDVSPTTNAPIEHGRTRPSNELRQRIREWKKARMQVLISAAQGSPREPEQIGKVDT